MAKRGRPAENTPGAKPKRLRKQLRKAEKRLRKAEADRDQANATVEALSIIADEIRTAIDDERQRASQHQRDGASLMIGATGPRTTTGHSTVPHPATEEQTDDRDSRD